MTETDETLERPADEAAELLPEPSDSFLPEEVDEELEGAGDGLELDDRQSEEIRTIFAATLPQYLEPVEEMIAQVLRSGATADTLEALGGTLSSLTVAATRVGFDVVVEKLEAFSARVEGLAALAGEPVDLETREAILGDLIDLKDLARELGGGEAEPHDGAGTIYQALRDQTDLDEAILPRLTAAGLTRVEQLTMADPGEIAAVTGLSPQVVAELLRRVTGQAAPRAAAPSRGKVEELSLDPSDLRRVLEQKLRQQVEAEAAIEELRAEIGRWRAETRTRREALRSAQQAREALRAELSEAGGALRERRARLAEAEAGRRALLRRYEDAAQEVQTQEARLQAARARLEQITHQDEALGGEVEALTERVRRMLGRVGKQRETVDSIGGRGAGNPIKADR